ncbi:MAG: DUF2779 domain-containing protein [Gammaproteobacteria bacterium CG_4_10_14_0_8_um_filter_38_16]|nr:MAG: DUF2779 domain-containing protein [Gammaproteobacteria bacterium CG_4_10_14_0_8_um_filter_38_16]PJA03565.1 MAG: DUF2779 domain-containing protein [Gammaproteobacteria bacterium CG_4_10_14_0_2_um_filter_38_22]PJB10134.1 MAG: DUF2779 domain-containing protein [Gammaproteobacteria bacterium CG_4_9_14_3_um_filter_38_9]
MTNLLSKSQFLKGRHCLKRIWLYNYRRDLMQEQSAFQESIMRQGTEVGKLAQCLFPGGVLIDEDYQNISGAVDHTNAVMTKNPAAIFEGAFVYDDILIRVDILKRNDDDSFDLIEVKSSTSLKKEHISDCAIQAYVLQQCGIKLQRVCVMYLNNQYRRIGELDLEKLFIIEAIDDRIHDELANVPMYLDTIRAALSQNNEPSWDIGSICKNPYQCEFKNYCWRDVSKKSIHFISRITDKQRRDLIDNGISLTKDVPENFKLTAPQSIQVSCEKNQDTHIDTVAIKNHLSQLQYPLYFLDFETCGYAIPQYDETKPYQHLPFQYSLHVRRTPDAELEHYEFLFDQKENPSRSLAEELISHIGSVGSVVVYYASFEGSRIKEMAETFNDLSEQLLSIHTRLWDLQTPFAKKWYYHPDFNGSASIKDVLPVLVPELSYKNLAIQKGDEAQFQYQQLINLSENSADRIGIKKALLEYCKLDTMAMVYILNQLQLIN